MYNLTLVVQRIFNFGAFEAPVYKELKNLVYRTLAIVIIYRSYILSKLVRFFGPPCTITKDSI